MADDSKQDEMTFWLVTIYGELKISGSKEAKYTSDVTEKKNEKK